MTLEGSGVVLQLLKVHHLLDLKKQNKPLTPIESSTVDSDRVSYQLLVSFVLEGDLSPSDEGDLGEEVAIQQLFEKQSARLPSGSQDKTAFVLLPKILLQALHVNSHAANVKHKTWPQNNIIMFTQFMDQSPREGKASFKIQHGLLFFSKS